MDWERLRRALGEAVDAGKERYGLSWPGKAACFTNIQTLGRATSQPARGESVEFEATGHVVIEGYNLEVLKLPQKCYLGAGEDGGGRTWHLLPAGVKTVTAD